MTLTICVFFAPSFFKRLRLNYPNQNTDRASRRFVKGMRPLKVRLSPAPGQTRGERARLRTGDRMWYRRPTAS